MSPVIRGQMAEFLAPGLNMRTFNRYREKPEIYRSINNVQSSTRAYEEDFAYTGFGPLAPQGELESTIMDEPFKLGGVRYIHKKYGLGFEISEEMRDDDQYNVMLDLAGDLGKSARYTAELFGHDVYNNGFTSAKYVGRDGQPLFAHAHPLPAIGGTARNRPAADVDLSQTALEVAWASFQTQVDDRGMPIDIFPTILLVHPSEVLLARRLLESGSLNFYGQNPGEINPLQGWVTIVSSPYLTDPDAWFLLGPPNEIDVRFWWRKAPDTRTWDDDDAEGVIHKISQRHSNGFGDWRGTYGSPGI
jgi:phage major head subunit gpT-like protein